MDERIREHLKYLNRYYLLLLDSRKLSLEDFKNDQLRQSSTERYLHLAIESCLNIGNRILRIYQFEKPVRTPETYADIFKELRAAGVIDPGFSEQMVKMVKFRNRLVHLYWELDVDTVYSILQENLDDFITFREKVVKFLKENPIS